MKIFLGSSRESLPIMRRIACWLPEGSALPWDAHGTFRDNYSAWDELLRHSRTVDGAILVFAEDDHTRSRKIVYPTTRDNVWLEYGLFVGALGRDRVRGIMHGTPRRATDLDGITLIQLPKSTKSQGDQAQVRRAEQIIGTWATELSPIRLKGLTTDVALLLGQRPQLDVETLLADRAPQFTRLNKSCDIRALCSNKGAFGPAYYKDQFRWVLQWEGTRLRRLFVRMKDPKLKTGFTRNERRGILQHVEAASPHIQIKWVWGAELGDSGYDDSLGFAVFGDRWLVHWGVKAGYCYNDKRDKEVARLLSRQFNALWKSANSFTPELIGRIGADRGRR